MRRFLVHEEACAQVTDSALHLVDNDLILQSPLKPYNEALTRIGLLSRRYLSIAKLIVFLDELQDEASCLQTDISKLLSSRAGDDAVHKVLLASSSLVQLRAQNLSSTRALVTICKQNLRLWINANSH
jgi:hypothetical protein